LPLRGELKSAFTVGALGVNDVDVGLNIFKQKRGIFNASALKRNILCFLISKQGRLTAA
jgi:hypothetical protein